MKALSLKQPWAWLIVKGLKSVENRKWSTKYRGPLLIHASKNYDREGYFWITQKFGNIFNPEWDKPPDFTFGAIVGKVDMSDCVQAYDSPWFFGPYGFIFRDAFEFIDPIPYKGQLGIFEVPDSVIGLELG